MLNVLRSFLPRAIHQPISTLRTLRRARDTDRLLRSKDDIELTSDHIANLTVVGDRTELLMRLPRGGVVAEVGVAEGAFSKQILEICRPTTLHLIDLWSESSARYADGMERTRAAVREELGAGRVKIHKGLSWDVLETLDDASLDWVYLDAAHTYDAVARDLAAAEPKLKADGLICGHDYTRWASSGVNRWGVVEAVNEFCVRRGWEMLYLTNEASRHLSYAIRRSTTLKTARASA